MTGRLRFSIFGLCLCACLVVMSCGCRLLRSNPLSKDRGAVVLVFDTRTFGDLKMLRNVLSAYDARATVFVAGQITRGSMPPLYDLRGDGNDIGLSGLRGTDPQLYCQMFGQQKYFQDEIVTQVLGAHRYGLHPRYFLLGTLAEAKSETLTLPSFLVDKGFARVVHKMPTTLPPRAKSPAELKEPLIHVYDLTTNTFDRAQIASLAKNNKILVVAPNRQVLPDLLEEANAQQVPFATLSDLKKAR